MTYHQWVGGRDISWGWRDVRCKNNMQMGSVPKISFFHGCSSRTHVSWALLTQKETWTFPLSPSSPHQIYSLRYYHMSRNHLNKILNTTFPQPIFNTNTVMLLGLSNTCWLLCLNGFTSLPHLFFCVQIKMLLLIGYSLIGWVRYTFTLCFLNVLQCDVCLLIIPNNQ